MKPLEAATLARRLDESSSGAKSVRKESLVGQAFKPDVRLESLTYFIPSEHSKGILPKRGQPNDAAGRKNVVKK